MTEFVERADDEYAVVYLEHTDKPLPEVLNPNLRYAYFKTIAKGGKAIIQTCRDMHLGRTIVYKKLRPEFADDAVEQQRFLREARVSAMLQHPNTMPIYEVGRDNRGHLYFTMKLVHGYTLREVLDYRERYDLKQLINVVVQVANALEYAHAHGVIHRDIKPENILVGPYGEVLILDWGLAKVWSEDGAPAAESQAPKSLTDKTVNTITDHGQVQGTITYMSPEQIRRDPAIDFRADVFSLGVVLYEILAGRTPHVAETVNQMAQLIQETDPLKPSAHAGHGVPRLLEWIAMQCIQREPERRLRGCSEMLRHLREEWD